MVSFKSQLDTAYKKKVIGGLDKTTRAVALFVDSELVNETPVDKGRARANWLPSLNDPDTRQIEGPAGNKPPIGPVLDGFRVLEDRILLTNNLPYIRRLNDGWSDQAPAGFIDNVLARAKRIV